VETQLARCWYARNGVTSSRYNGGCGCVAISNLNESPGYNHCNTHSAYANIGPDGKYIYGDSPEAERCRCTSINETVFPESEALNAPCFWRGPAFNTSHGSFNASELKQVVEQREHALAHLQSWNDEVVIDSCRLQDVLKTDPASALLAVFFYDGDGEHTERNLNQAEALQQQLLKKYGVRLPLVGVSSSVVVSSTSGPFFEHPPPETPGSAALCDFGNNPATPYCWDDSCAKGKVGCYADGKHVQCRWCGVKPYTPCPKGAPGKQLEAEVVV